MNTATATQCIQTTFALSIALLISGTTVASSKSPQTVAEVYRQGYESLAENAPNCAGSLRSRALIVDHGLRQAAPSCSDASESINVTPPPVRLARPLSDSQYIRSGESIRYSF